MNRRLLIPAICCLLAFACLYAALNQAVGLERDRRNAAVSTSSAPLFAGTASLSENEAERLLAALRDDYVQRWRAWESSPHRLLSRAAPRTFSPGSVELVLSPRSSDERSSLLLATISIRRGVQTQTIPCVVDPLTRRTHLFHEGNWLTDEEWLKTAPAVASAKGVTRNNPTHSHSPSLEAM